MLILKNLLNNRVVQIILALIIGLIIGAIFYPSKTITEKEEAKYREKLTEVQKEYDKQIADITTKTSKEIEESQQKIAQIQSSYSKVVNENKDLHRSIKKRTIKVTKPDGTIIEQTLVDSESEMVTQVTEDLKQTYESRIAEVTASLTKEFTTKNEKLIAEHRSELQKKDQIIEEYKSSKVTEINKRNFAIAAGYMSNKKYYGSVQRDLVGPLFLDITGTSGVTASGINDSAIGMGFGIRF